MRLRLVAGLVALLCFAGVTGGAGPARASSNFTILDTLGAATPTATFSVFQSFGLTISRSQVPGPLFSLERPTVLTEIGGFVNNCKSIVHPGVPQCPGTLPFIVQIRPSLNGVPDPSAVLGTFVLTHDDNPLVFSYESVTPNVILDAGTYFALFVPQNDDQGALLGGSLSPSYLADSTNMGFINLVTGMSASSMQFGAVRILGAVLPTSIKPCKKGGWHAFGVFKSQGDCVSYVKSEGKNPPG